MLLDELQRHRHQIGVVPIELGPEIHPRMRRITPWKEERIIAVVSCVQALFPRRSFYLRDEAIKEEKCMSQPQQPHWHPITMLPTIASFTSGMLQDAGELWGYLHQAQSKPWVLNDDTVNEVISVYTIQQQDFALFDEQLKRWSEGRLTPKQRHEVERLAEQMKTLHEVVADILALANELSRGTIEKQMATSDERLGLEFLMRMPGGEEKPC
jgi:hypothetical protein